MFNTIVSAVFIFFALVVLLVGILGSRKRHWVSSAVKLLLVIVSALLSMIFSTMISKAVAPPIYSLIVENIDKPQITGILADIPSAKAIFCVLVALVLTIPIFILLFSIIRTVTNFALNKLLTKCFLKLLKKDPEEKYEKKFEPLSMLFSALASFLVYIVVLIPIVGALDLAASVAKVSVQDELVIEISTAATDNVGSKTVRALGGRGIYNFLTRYEVNGEKISMAEESKFISSLGKSALALVNEDESLTAKEKADMLRNTGVYLENTTIIPTLASDFVNVASEDWLNGRDFHDIPFPSIGKQYDPIISSFLECTSDSTCATMRKDLNTLINIVAVAIEKNTNTANGDMLFNILSNEELVSGIALEILNNQDLAPMMGAIMNMSLDMIGDTLEVPETSDEVYNEFINDVILTYNTHVTDTVNEETLNALSKEITKVFSKHGTELTNGVDACIATSLICEFGDGSQMTPEALKAFFSNGATATPVSTTDTVGVATIAEKISSVYSKGDDEAALKNKIVAILTELRPFSAEQADQIATVLAQKALAALEGDGLDASSAQFVDANDFVIKNQIIIQSDLIAANGTYSNAQDAAHDIAKIMKDLAVIIDDLSKNGNDIEIIMKDLGPLLDDMHASDFIGKENADKVLIAILQSDVACESLNISLHRATDMALSINKGISATSTYMNKLNTLSHTISMLKSASDGTSAAHHAEALLSDITPESAESIKKILATDTMINYGIDEDHAENVSGLVSEVVDNMSVAKANGMSEENYQKEAAAIDDMMNIAMSALNNTEENLFGADGKTGITATDYVNRALDSEIISNALVDYVYSGSETPTTNPLNVEVTLNESEKEEVISALSSNLQAKQSTVSAEELEEYKKVIISVASIVNFDIYIDANGNILPR